MKKIMVQLLDTPQIFKEHQFYRVMSLQVRDDGKVAHGSREAQVVVQIEQQDNQVHLFFDNPGAEAREGVTLSQEDWQRLHRAPDWRHVSWLPFVTYERETPGGKATLTHREDPLLRQRRDQLSSEFWQARFYHSEGILTTFVEFSCLAGRDDAFCEASEWTMQAERGEHEPGLTILALVEGQIERFVVTKGFAHNQSLWQEFPRKDIFYLMTEHTQQHGHSTILVRDTLTLKALLPNTKVAGEHSPTGLPIH